MNYAIILAAGQSQRFGRKKDKLLSEIKGHPLVYYSIMAFNEHPDIDSIVLVGNKQNADDLKKLVKTYLFRKVKKVVLGGLTRQKSLEKGFSSLPKNTKKDDIILVHNGANPLVSQEEIFQIIEKTKKHGACIVGHSIKSTIKEVNKKKIIKTHDRKKLFEAQTPQAGKFGVLKKALSQAKKDDFEATDEAMLLENIGQEVQCVEAGENNFKVTTQGDLLRARTILGELPEDFRVGIGQDSHMFDDSNIGLCLGGLLLKDEPKLLANSDGDVVLHAIFNALSQALGDMSLGFYADDLCEKQGIKDSTKYLEPLLKKLKKQKFKINSLGLMIEGSRPGIDPVSAKIKKSLSKILDLNTRRIGITATSGEKCTVFGNGLGMQCFAIVSIKKV